MSTNARFAQQLFFTCFRRPKGSKTMSMSLAKTGFPTVTLATIDADSYAAQFQMHKGVHYKRFLEICQSAAPVIGYSAGAIRLLGVLHGYTREVDWHDGRPICYATNERLAADTGRTVSSIKKQLKELSHFGLISRGGTSNGTRSGGRHMSGPRKGHLLDTTVGINLAPLAAKFHDHEIAVEQFETEFRQLQKMKREALRFNRSISQMHEQCLALGIHKDKWSDIVSLTDILAPEILKAAHCRSLERMTGVWQRLAEASRMLTNLLHDHFVQAEQNKLTPQGGINNPQTTSTSPESPSGDISALREGCSRQHSFPPSPLDTSIDEHEATFTQHGEIKASEIPHLFPSIADFICFEADARHSRSWEALGRAITAHGHNLIQLKRDHWIRALNELPLGYAQMMFAITLEWHVKNPSNNAGRYFMGMWNKYHKDELNLWATIMKRRKMDTSR
jgi:hypothetical protein